MNEAQKKALIASRDTFRKAYLQLKSSRDSIVNLLDSFLNASNNILYVIDKIVAEPATPVVPTIPQSTDLSQRLRLRALSLAAMKVGLKELTGNNDGPAIVEFQEGQAWLKNQPWCASFMSWCFKTAAQEIGIKRPFEHTASVNKLYELAQSKVWFIKTNPQPGDIMLLVDLQDWSKSHTGIVREVAGNKIHTIEGNYKNSVARVTRDAATVFGYMRVKVD